MYMLNIGRGSFCAPIDPFLDTSLSLAARGLLAFLLAVETQKQEGRLYVKINEEARDAGEPFQALVEAGLLVPEPNAHARKDRARDLDQDLKIKTNNKILKQETEEERSSKPRTVQPSLSLVENISNTSNTKKEKDARASAFDAELKVAIPPELSTDAFLKAWSEWKADRKERKKKMTKRAATMQLNKLGKYHHEIATAMLEQSMERGWQGIFPLPEEHPLMVRHYGTNEDLSDASIDDQDLRSA